MLYFEKAPKGNSISLHFSASFPLAAGIARQTLRIPGPGFLLWSLLAPFIELPLEMPGFVLKKLPPLPLLAKLSEDLWPKVSDTLSAL